MRIAHCSDLHLLSLAGARALDFANKRWIGGLNLLANRGRHHHTSVFEAMVADFNRSAIDHIVCTGDITNLALEEEFRYARQFFDGIELGPEHVTVIPGNHDAYVARGARHFAEHFEAYSRPDADWAWDGDDRWPVVRVRGALAVVALSTSLQTPWFTAWGRIGDVQLARLEQALSDARLAGRFRVVMIHHPPAGERARSAVRGLRDRNAFADILARAGAELVLHGHEHIDLREELAGPGGVPIAVRGIQSGTYEAGKLDRRARYRIYEIDTAAAPRPRLVGDGLRVWHPELSRFVPEDPAPALASVPA
ncbi:MAG TPA: metallophosphoesterase [Kofleriaceae bacterium]|nr:metallophosphoesterase [Kofleriaceae bacterium]